MKTLLYFLLGFFLVFSAGLSFAASQGDIRVAMYGGGYVRSGLNAEPKTKAVGLLPFTATSLYTIDFQGMSFDTRSDTSDYQENQAVIYVCSTRVSNGQPQWNSYYFSGGYVWSDFHDYLTSKQQIPMNTSPQEQCTLQQPCLPPNALAPSGACVPCPSGVFLVGSDQCIPSCNYSRPYVPGLIYNPTDGSGTCIAPECGSGQVANEEGRCVPNCPTGQKIDVNTGSCVPDCVYGTHVDGSGQCVNDCPDGFMKDAETGTCIPSHECEPGQEKVNGQCLNQCLPGETRDYHGACTSPETDCPFGQHKNEAGECVSSPVLCPGATSWDDATKTCKSDPVQQQTTKDVITAPDGTKTTTTDTTTTVSNGQGGTSTGSTHTVHTESPSGVSSTSTTYTPPAVQKYKSPEHKLDWQGWNSQLRRISEQGPVKLLHDVRDLVASFDVQPETPVFHPVVGGHQFTIDLSPFDGLAKVVRFFLASFMTIGVFWFGYKLFGFI